MMPVHCDVLAAEDVVYVVDQSNKPILDVPLTCSLYLYMNIYVFEYIYIKIKEIESKFQRYKREHCQTFCLFCLLVESSEATNSLHR